MKSITLAGKHVELRSVREEDIERVRQWRNSPAINQYFIWRGHITPDGQQDWFRRISESENDYFFVIWCAGRPVGLTEIKNIDWVRSEGEGGTFIADEMDRNSHVSFESFVLLSDFVFYRLGLRTRTARVLTANRRALRYNLGLGYREVRRELIQTPAGEMEVAFLELTEADYRAQARKIKRLIGDGSADPP